MNKQTKDAVRETARLANEAAAMLQKLSNRSIAIRRESWQTRVAGRVPEETGVYFDAQCRAAGVPKQHVMLALIHAVAAGDITVRCREAAVNGEKLTGARAAKTANVAVSLDDALEYFRAVLLTKDGKVLNPSGLFEEYAHEK